jgi:hypothetical protein
MMLRCPLCGCSHYEQEGSYFRCTRCTVMFTDMKKFYSGGRSGRAQSYGNNNNNQEEASNTPLPDYYEKENKRG